MSHSNKLLSLLSPEDCNLIIDHLKVVTISQGQVLAEPHEAIEHAYFPHSGIVSFVVEMSDGQLIETGMIGRDGVIGRYSSVGWQGLTEQNIDSGDRPSLDY